MHIGTVANVVTASAVVIALVVGTGQLLHLRRRRVIRAVVGWGGAGVRGGKAVNAEGD
jgi:hypothetical protein